MCWMALVHDDDGDAVRGAVDALRRHEDGSGGHSWGIAWPTDDGLEIETGLGRVPPYIEDVIDADADVALGHTRYATRGDITLANAHPFEVYDDGQAGEAGGDVIAVLAHNGTWYDAPDTDRADSYYIARLLEAYVDAGHDLETAVELTGAHTGETITVLSPAGDAYAYSGRFTITGTDSGVRSSGGTPIPDGTVKAL